MAEHRSEETLRIAVTFPRADGLGPVRYRLPMTCEVVTSFIPTAEVRSRALMQLQQRGFSVTTEGRLTASVRGSKQAFETLFGTQLSTVTFASTATKKYSATSVLYPGDDAPWAPDAAITALIDDAYIQWPHVYMSQRFPSQGPAPLPPRANYYHLRVPGDVAMLLNAAKVHRQGYTGKGIRVAMIDSGFAHEHAYFKEMGYNTSVILAPGATDQALDGVGHGTGESANLFAVAPDITFIGVKLDNEQDQVSGASLLEGLQEALKHRPHIISVSLGHDLVPQNLFTGNRLSSQHLDTLPNNLKALEAEVNQAIADGVVMVFSAGNGDVSFPGMMPDVISAGGVYIGANGQMQASDYASAFVSKPYAGRSVPDFCGLVGLAENDAAYIMLPVPSDSQMDSEKAAADRTRKRDGWAVFSGTSASAPQLAGICALLLEKNPGLTPSDIKNVIRRTCRDVVNGHANPDSNNGNALQAGTGLDGATGAGLVDAFAAWQQVS